ncbi:hypothetical protein BAE44_0015882, partial [Dichanthelium oligosanthes]
RGHLPEDAPGAGRDPAGEGVQRHGPAEAVVPGVPARVAEQAAAAAGRAQRALLRPAEALQRRRRRGRRVGHAVGRREGLRAGEGGRVAGAGERGAAVGAGDGGEGSEKRWNGNG